MNHLYYTTSRSSCRYRIRVDATVQYAKGYDSAKNSWWPQVTQEDYRTVKSPYNTYLHPGLPPGPIASPGLESIRAAAAPSKTDFLYYLHDLDGKIHYAKTIEEHQQNVREFL
ncbi:endolytic transglycosylase MltG [Candidatus Curtissbacteria bacterium]|nr:endolytic transglycosylase MltG [Candidatus Curtissbacteria bacterium]